MKKNKKLIMIFLGLLVCCVVGFIFLFANKNSQYALTLDENKWISSNKQNVIDISILNDVPILSYEGTGVVYDYLDYLEDSYSLNFNVISSKLDSPGKTDIKMSVKTSKQKDDIVLLEDNLVLVGDTILNSDISKIQNAKIGIINGTISEVKKYFDSGVEFIEYQTYADLKSSLVYDENNTRAVDMIIASKMVLLNDVLSNDYQILFQFNDLKRYFTIDINNNVNLKNILVKLYNKWYEERYFDVYYENQLKSYFNLKNVSDVLQKQLLSKSYTYGFINYGVYNSLKEGQITGLNGLLLKDFNKFSGISITYTRYNSLNKLLEDFNNKKVDFIFNNIGATYTNNVYNTIGTFEKNFVIISNNSNKTVIDNVYSLKDKEVLAIKDSYLEKYLTSVGVKVKSYNNLNDLVQDYSKMDITIVDLENYNYYKTSYFKNSKINHLFNIDEKYNFIINDTEENAIFKDLFNFYLEYNSLNQLVNSNYNEIAYKNSNFVYILIGLFFILLVYTSIDLSSHIKKTIKKVKKSKKDNLSKEDKIKYIDQLTSLKNRAYLNSKIDAWDESEVYPQSIIIIDLNNISYINDNYGREEGDKVIAEAANILIQNQLENTEIIRTDGNEFLIYMVGYSEKQVISYIRKLNKELKGLSHGFGSASGYSIIKDAIKTIDDAVNEATLDMKNNKEDINY